MNNKIIGYYIAVWFFMISSCIATQKNDDACLQVGKELTKAFQYSDMSSVAAQLALTCQKNKKQILPAGFDVNGHNDEGDTPLTQAAYQGWPNKVKTLLALGADIHRKAGKNKSLRTPLQAAYAPVTATYSTFPDYARIPILGYYLKKSGCLEWLGFHRTQLVDKSEVVRILLNAGASENPKN